MKIVDQQTTVLVKTCVRKKLNINKNCIKTADFFPGGWGVHFTKYYGCWGEGGWMDGWKDFYTPIFAFFEDK